MKKLKIAGLIIIIVIISLYILIIRINSFQRNGEIMLRGLSAPAKILRDEKGMPYIYASNLEDAFLAQGFITAQDRLFTMELTKLLSQGRLSELAGGRTRDLDIQMRTIGLHRNAKKHAMIISEDDRRLLKSYVEGINLYINDRKNELPVEFTLADIEPERWKIEDVITIYYFMGWNSASNIKTKLLALMIMEKIGLEKAREIFPISTNPDDDIKKIAPVKLEKKLEKKTDKKIKADNEYKFIPDDKLTSFLKDSEFKVGIGSNNWAVGPGHSPGGKPIVANDPHIETNLIPGPWYPLGIIIPGQRSVGVTIPGIPGIQIGRNSGLAFGVTNSYNDAQDLYIETIDPQYSEQYLEGKKSLPFEIIHETLKIRDKKSKTGFKEEKFTVQLTRRGPVISSVTPGLKTKKIITLRWSPFETMENGSIFLRDQFMAKNVKEFRLFLKKITFIMLNWIFADTEGNIGWQTSGKIPLRSQGDSTLPFEIKDSTDNWKGWIPFDKMPQEYNPEKGWLGTSNQSTVKSDYPYYISSYFSPYYRYARLKELMTSKEKITVDDHWSFQRDAKNLMGKKIAPVMAEALLSYKDTEALGKILKNWDFFDNREEAAPAIFHSVYKKFAYLVFEDELGDPVAKAMLDVPYFWEERLEKMVLEGDSQWFDNVFTHAKETMNDIFHKAAILSMKEMGKEYGPDPTGWKWGKMHGIEFINPLAREGIFKQILGGGYHPMSGSGETLYRGIYNFNKSFDVKVSASLRMVADLSDNEKITAVLPGGVSARLFDRHHKDQIKPYMNGEKLYWWFSDDKISTNAQSILMLKPLEK